MEIECRRRWQSAVGGVGLGGTVRDTRPGAGTTGGIGFARTIALINTTEAGRALINADARVIM
jgi:hypothetical protein